MFGIWPENVRALELFLSLWSQMRIVAGFGVSVRTGFGAADVESVLRMKRVPGADRAHLMDDLLEMGQAAAAVLNRRRDG